MALKRPWQPLTSRHCATDRQITGCCCYPLIWLLFISSTRGLHLSLFGGLTPSCVFPKYFLSQNAISHEVKIFLGGMFPDLPSTSVFSSWINCLQQLSLVFNCKSSCHYAWHPHFQFATYTHAVSYKKAYKYLIKQNVVTPVNFLIQNGLNMPLWDDGWIMWVEMGHTMHLSSNCIYTFTVYALSQIHNLETFMK